VRSEDEGGSGGDESGGIEKGEVGGALGRVQPLRPGLRRACTDVSEHSPPEMPIVYMAWNRVSEPASWSGVAAHAVVA
jgi:hypothetical protein